MSEDKKKMYVIKYITEQTARIPVNPDDNLLCALQNFKYQHEGHLVKTTIIDVHLEEE